MNRVYIPPVKWPFMWQWKSHTPGLSGTMSATAVIIGVSMIMSVRMWFATSVWPCQVCGPMDQVVQIAAKRVTRDLTDPERAAYLHEPA